MVNLVDGSDTITSFNFTIIHNSGTSIPQADFLSRCISPIEYSMPSQLVLPLFPRNTLLQLQSTMDWNSNELCHLIPRKIIGGIYYYLSTTCVPIIPAPTQKEILNWHCNLLHMGGSRLLRRLQQLVVWVGMKSHVTAAVASCDFCSCWRRKNGRAFDHGKLIPQSRGVTFSEIEIDILGPLALSREGDRFVVSVIDTFSKFLITWAIPSATSALVCSGLVTNVIFPYGIPMRVRSDRGTQFMSNEFDRCVHSSTSSTHPLHRTIPNRRDW